MIEKTPTLVVLYDWGHGDRERVAEFHLTPDQQVHLTIHNPQRSAWAREIYDHGVEIIGEARYLSWKDDAPAFMRALLQPFRTTYNSFRDESEQVSDSPSWTVWNTSVEP